jgi:RNA polymerase sigma-70 factor (sigma-E family)
MTATEGASLVSHGEQFDGLAEFLADRGAALLGTAVLLAGSQAAGEDMLQVALERLLRRWETIDGDPEGYLRRTLYHLAVDRWRWRGRHPEVGLSPDAAPGGRDPAVDIDLREALWQALASLPPRQRAVLVLRYFEQLTEAEIAAALGCSAGTVKSSAARGLRRLRSVVEDWDSGERGTGGAGPDRTASRASGERAEDMAPRSLATNGARA